MLLKKSNKLFKIFYRTYTSVIINVLMLLKCEKKKKKSHPLLIKFVQLSFAILKKKKKRDNLIINISFLSSILFIHFNLIKNKNFFNSKYCGLKK